MRIEPIKVEVPLGEDVVTIETGKLAKQADGSVVVRLKNAMLLATVVSNSDDSISRDFLPLSVDYQEKYAANGRIPGGFLKREGPLSAHEILVSRLVDRAIRPLFPENYQYETQVNIFLVSADETVLPDSLACLAASAAIAVSDIPMLDAVAEARIARVNGQWIINPSPEQLANADIDLMVGGTSNNVLMVEGECNEVSEEELLTAIEEAHKSIQVLCKNQKELALKSAAFEKRSFKVLEEDLAVEELVSSYTNEITGLLKKFPEKDLRQQMLDDLYNSLLDCIIEEVRDEKAPALSRYFKLAVKNAMREMLLSTGIRIDGRKPDEIRLIDCEVDFLPSAHGSALFTRGETQSLTSVTLGSSKDAQLLDSVLVQGTQNFMLHYNFPGFSTGEVKFNRGPGRREIGHGHLAQRSLKKVLPSNFPYTIRIVSDILESNGSSSMATVCAGSLALMDAGVPIASAVSGVAMGLVADGKRFAVLSDISADEDHLGDMDFKVTGTKKGVCACQMDLKTTGIPSSIMLKALKQAKEARLYILDKMAAATTSHRSELKPQIPRIERLEVPLDSIGAIIGPGGKIIQELQKSSGTTLSIKEENDKGWLEIFAPDKEKLDAVKKQIKQIIARPEVGETYEGIVKNIMPFGAFVEILPGKEGLVHISEIAWKRTEKVEDVLSTDMKVKVMLLETDPKTGKMKLSIKALLPKPDQAAFDH